jgi:GTP pyrophosphokinase
LLSAKKEECTLRETYETFYERIRPLFSPKDLAMIDLAYVLAKHSHRFQTRKDEKDAETGQPLRYFEHPRRVAIILLDEVRCREVDLVISAFLHDGTEDTRFLTKERIECYFGEKVAAMVTMVTKLPKTQGGFQPDYVSNLKRFGNWKELLLKACDRLDNLRSLPSGTPEFQRKQVLETRAKYFPLFEVMVQKTPKRYKKGAKNVRDMIHHMVTHVEEQLAKAESDKDDD